IHTKEFMSDIIDSAGRAPTASPGDNSTKIATIAYVDGAISTALSGGIVSPFPPFFKPLSTDFTWINQLSTTATDEANRLKLVLPTNGTDPNWRLFKYNTALPSTPYSVVMAFDFATADG